MELAITKLAISTISPIIQKLGSYIYASNLGGDVTAEEIKKLTNVILPTIKTVIQEAELVPSDHLTPWLEDLQEAAFEAEDLIDLYEYKKIKYQVSSSPEFIKKQKKRAKKTFGFLLPKSSFKFAFERLQKAADEAKNLQLLIASTRKQQKHTNAQASTSTCTVSTLYSPLFGRDEECDIIIKFLLDEPNTNSCGIIAIQGIGGSGKTSTAQGVYNHKKVEVFDLRMWVHVSRNFDVYKHTKEIIESAVKGESSHISNLDVLQTKLKESISTKKFLLVLDDVWCEDKMQWDQLLSPLNEVKGNGSKIIMTTRMEKVASVLQVDQVIPLGELKIEDCWSILKHYAFRNSETIIEDMELANIGNQIISKVKYSPLALRIVGSLLYKRVSVNDWEIILKQDILKETMDVLLLSFQHLPPHLQRCFAYCSLFPKGYKFLYLEELVPLWIAQGFVENTNESELTLEEKGRIYIEELLSYSFFEIDEDYHRRSYYKMHDLLHDLAEKISRKYCHRIEKGSLDIPTTCIHLSMYWMECLKKVDIFDMLKLRNLRTLIILYDSDIEHIHISERRKVKFQNPTKLRALYVGPYLPMEALSNLHIDRQKHLRYLYIKSDGELNRSLLAKLYHLQFLYCYKDGTHGFVQGFENLINLRTLKLHNCDYHPKLNIKKLTLLQNLKVFHTIKDGENGIVPLQSLNLHGSLSIKNLENIKSEEESAKAMLSKKQNLNELTFEWNSTVNSISDGSKSCEDVLEGLEPHPYLERLSIKCYQGVKSPNWMTSENSRLLKLSLSGCGSLKEISYLPPLLEELRVEECNDLIQLPPVGHTLRILELINCSKLMPPSMSSKSLCLLTHLEIRGCARNECQLFNDLPFLAYLQDLVLEGFSELETFPNLSPTVTSLMVASLSRLTSLGNLQHCTALSSLYIYDCNMLTGLESLQYCKALYFLDINDCNMLTGLESLQYCISLKHLTVRRGMLIMTDGSIFGDGDINMCLPCSLETLHIRNRKKAFYEKEGYPSRDCLTDLQVQTLLDGFIRPFPPLLEDNLHHLSSLRYLCLKGFTTLPSLEKLSSLRYLDIIDCPDVELLPNLPISLQGLLVKDCPKLKVKYKKGGPLHSTISHIPRLTFW